MEVVLMLSISETDLKIMRINKQNQEWDIINKLGPPIDGVCYSARKKEKINVYIQLNICIDL